MKRISIPGTDLTLFPLGLGTAQAGLAWSGAEADALYDAFLDAGGNLIDTAHVYSDWVPGERARSERVLGEWLSRSGKRNRVLIMTKGGHPEAAGPHADMHISRMSRADMTADLEGSLRQLGTDCIDIYFYHRDDVRQPVTDLIEVMEDFRRAGKIRYYACSNWSTLRMRQAEEYCRSRGYRGFVANQSLFNLGYRFMQPLSDDTLGYADAAMQQFHRTHPECLLMPYSGICNGFFHDFLQEGEAAVSGSPYCTVQNLRLAGRVSRLCRQYHATVTQVVLGFFTCREFPCTPLYAPRNPDGIREAMATFDIPFSAADYEL